METRNPRSPITRPPSTPVTPEQQRTRNPPTTHEQPQEKRLRRVALITTIIIVITFYGCVGIENWLRTSHGQDTVFFSPVSATKENPTTPTQCWVSRQLGQLSTELLHVATTIGGWLHHPDQPGIPPPPTAELIAK